MADHTTLATGQPVLLAHAVTVGVGLIAGALGLTLDNGTVTLIATVGWVLISSLATAIAHSRVSPIAGGWQVQVKNIVEQTVQDVVSTQLNLTTAIAPSGQPSYVPPPPPAPASPPPAPAPAPTDSRARYMSATTRWADSPLRRDAGDTATWPQPRP